MGTPPRPHPERVAALFEVLADLAPDQVAGKLDELCAGDAALRDVLEQLLAHDRAAAGGFLAPPHALFAEALCSPSRVKDAADRAAEDIEPIAVSSRMGRYYVLHKLAEGGMGFIYVGYDESLDRRVALKVLRRGAAAGQWLLREGQALGRLSHPNVVAVHEVGEHDGRVFLAMELIEGPTLRHWLEEHPRSFADTMRLFLQAGRGLAAAHEAGLVHRDFKPDNVLVGKDGRARVADFGIVASVEAPVAPAPREGAPDPREDAFAGRLTQTGALMGTPAFMAPEQFLGERATAASDQWSFCVALYRAAFGASPYPTSDMAEMARSVVSAPPALPPRRPEVPVWLAPILLRGLRRDPAARFPSMRDLLAEVERHLPRDPSLDPTLVVRERLLLSAIFLVGYAVNTCPMVNASCARILMSPRALIALPAIVLVTMLAVIAWGWRVLSRNRYGQRMAVLFPSLVFALLGHRLIALGIGMPVVHLLIEDMVFFATIWGLLGLTYEPWLTWLAVPTAIAAIVAGLSPDRVPLLVGLLGLAIIVAIAIRMFVDRHLTPEALVPTYEKREDGVGS